MMKRIVASFLLIASIFIGSAQARNEVVDAPKMPVANFDELTQTMSSRVVEIIDPLSIRLENGKIVYLTGLDYPDLDYYEPGNFSVMTLKILKDFLLDESVVLYQTKDAKQGRYNRMNHMVAHVVRKNDKIWVQGLMLSLGLARVRTVKSNPEMAEQMYALELSARMAKTGIWAVKGYQMLDPETVKLASGGFQIVEGKVEKAAVQKGRVFLNFGKDWKDDFTVSISGLSRRNFAKADLQPENWGGQKVRVRGWVESFNGPFIEIDHPAQVELLFSPKDVELPPEESPKTPAEKEDAKKEEPPKKKVIKRDHALP